MVRGMDGVVVVRVAARAAVAAGRAVVPVPVPPDDACEEGHVFSVDGRVVCRVVDPISILIETSISINKRCGRSSSRLRSRRLWS